MTMNFDKCKERYQNDPEFHTVVTFFYNLMFKNKLSLAELKDALSFAGLKFEMENIRKEYYDDDSQANWTS